MSDRIAKYGQFVASAGENIAYGTTGGKEIVLQLIIDDGVASRGHRENIFKPALKFLGSWTAGHVTYSSETVIDYAGGMTTNNVYTLLATIDCTPAGASAVTDTSADASTTDSA
jgi:hypothetical protein